jgi:hypothetical protein
LQDEARNKVKILEYQRVSFTYKVARQLDEIRGQLRSERSHASRLYLLVIALRERAHELQESLNQKEIHMRRQSESQEEEKRRIRKRIWEQKIGVLRLSTDVDALFLFFARRLAALAGARARYNDKLRENGAFTVLAALCQSPKLWIRRLAARALAGSGWNGYVEKVRFFPLL